MGFDLLFFLEVSLAGLGSGGKLNACTVKPPPIAAKKTQSIVGMGRMVGSERGEVKICPQTSKTITFFTRQEVIVLRGRSVRVCFS